MPPKPQRSVEHELFIRSFFAVNPPPRVANQLVAAMEEVRFEVGETLFLAGEPPERLFFVINGVVRLEAEGEPPWELRERSLVGIIDAALKRPRARTAIAVEPVDGISIEMQDYLDIMTDNFDFTKTTILFAASRIHELALELPPELVFPKLSEQRLLNIDLVRRDQPLDQIERLIVLHNARAHIDAPIQPLVSLAASVVEERWSPSEVIHSAGDESFELRFVAHGRVSVEQDVPKISGVFGPGGLLGGIGALAHEHHRCTATAREETITLRLRKEDLFDAMEDHSELTRTWFAFVARENERVRAALVSLGKDPDGAQARRARLTADHHPR